MSRASEICNEVAASRWKQQGSVVLNDQWLPEGAFDLFKKFAFKYFPNLTEEEGINCISYSGYSKDADKESEKLLTNILKEFTLIRGAVVKDWRRPEQLAAGRGGGIEVTLNGQTIIISVFYRDQHEFHIQAYDKP